VGRTRGRWTGKRGSALLWLVASLVLTPNAVASQQVRCVLAPQADARMVGECQAGDRVLGLRLERPAGELDAMWVGILSLPQGPLDVEVATYQYSDGPALIMRETAWRELSEYAAQDGRLVLAWDRSTQASPSTLDLEIVARARELLPQDDVWDREDDRNCENDGSSISLYCALAKATAEVMGRYQHRQPAMQAARIVIRAEWPDRVVSHGLMDFNNDPRTTMADVRRVFTLAEEALASGIR